jgi:hypothetical protein
MKSGQRWLVLSLVTLATSISGLLAAPVDDILAFSSFKQINPDELAGGTILTQRGGSSGFSRGLALQSCYVVNKPLADTANYLIWWDPSPHPELDVYLNVSFRKGEDPKFDQFNLNGKQKAVYRLIQDFAKAKDIKSDLQLSTEELKDLSQRLGSVPTSPDSPDFRKLCADYLSGILKQRYNQFLSGGLASLPQYDYSGSHLSVKDEITSLVNIDPKVTDHFKDIISDVLQPAPGSAGPNSYYWQLFKADTEATANLGAIYDRTTPEKIQILDCQFYVSNAYFVSVTLYELYPVTIQGKQQTLIWRADYVSAPMFAWLRGVDQMAATMLMMQSIKQSVRLFQADAHAAVK